MPDGIPAADPLEVVIVGPLTIEPCGTSVGIRI